MENLQNSSQETSANQPTSDTSISTTDSISKEKNNRLFQRGSKWLGAGVLSMAISFGINFVLFQEDKSFIIPMYVLTSIGAICIMKGLVDILGF